MRYNAGSEVYTQTLCHGLADRHEVHVFTREEDSFAHEPGLAPVRRRNEAWHIRPDGSEAYHRRFLRTFGFYEGVAAVTGHDGWHHIRFLVQHMLAAADAGPGLHVFVTHDLLVTATAARLLGKPLGKEAWPWYLEGAFFWCSAAQLESFGLRVFRIFDGAPSAVQIHAAHKMKHWMCRWALAEFGEFLWVDWDTVVLRRPDADFWGWCRAHGTPKFVRIPGYWATVNCGLYYAGAGWAEAMDRSFDAVVSEPNDELLWASVLPVDVADRPEFWWGERVVHVWSRDDFVLVTAGTYFAHVKHLEWADELRKAAGERPYNLH